MNPVEVTWAVAAVAVAGMIVRPLGVAEAMWAAGGAALLAVLGLLPVAEAARGIARGLDVYLFLTGMMLLAELARAQGLFDWLAAHATRAARGSAKRLFTLVYLVGTAVTVFLSNDATAVVLTPAVAAAVRAARAETPLPYLFVCAFIANAASFVLPISNPANLVVYGSHTPPLAEWLPRFALPSLLSIAATYWVLRWTQRGALRRPVDTGTDPPGLSPGGRIAGLGIGATVAALTAASAAGWQLGWPSFAAGALTAAAVTIRARARPWPLLGNISWDVLPLVAGLFVLVQALDRTGLAATLARGLDGAARSAPAATAWGAGAGIAVLCNLINNLPAGLLAATAIGKAHVPAHVIGATLVGVDLGPNLSVTGSLATILWLTALRREGFHVGGWRFLKLGAIVMPPALVLALGALTLAG